MPIAFAALALAVVAFVLWLSTLSKTKGLSARVASLLVETTSLADQLKTATAEQKKAHKALETRNEELTEIRKEIGGLKKKNFALQEDAKKAKSAFEDKLAEREKQLVARPAFENDEPEEPKKGRGPKADSRLPMADGRAPMTDSRSPIADDRSPMADSRSPIADDRSPMAESPMADGPSAEPVVAKADAELQRRFDNLSTENGDLSQRITKLEVDLRDALGEQRRMKKKVDDYRRAEMVVKSRMDLMNDKLGSMGRQYYDAISELAALKGHPAPAPRQPADKPEAAAASAAPASDEEEVQALSNALVLQQRDSAN